MTRCKSQTSCYFKQVACFVFEYTQAVHFLSVVEERICPLHGDEGSAEKDGGSTQNANHIK